MPKIVLTTLNARYAHAAFGLRYLMANMGELAGDTLMMEFDISWRAGDVVEAILKHEPVIVGIGVYIWNVGVVTQLVAELKRVRPEIVVVIGGPQVSYEISSQEICGLADYVVSGEADLEFGRLCGRILAGEKPVEKIIASPVPEMGQVKLPYELYDQKDIEHRVIYVEASRGCPFTCEFCLSSLDIPVRNVPLEKFLASMQGLLDRGVRQFKLVDRTFNLNLNISKAILNFFWERYTPELFLHFEMIPDRLPTALRELIVKFPAGALQFEVGVQSLNEKVCELISRRQDVGKLEDNLKFLRSETGVHVHADLIVGLPGEDMASFGEGFDRLVGMGPQEIQVGMLKRLPGTPIVRHDAEWGMVYSPAAPFEVLQTKLIDFGEMQRMRRFSRYWDLVANSGNFVRSVRMIWGEVGSIQRPPPQPSPGVPEEGDINFNTIEYKQGSPFWSFLEFSDWLFSRNGATHGIALGRLSELVFEFVTTVRGVEGAVAAEGIWEDYRRVGRSDRPGFLKPWIGMEKIGSVAGNGSGKSAASRQARHRGMVREADAM